MPIARRIARPLLATIFIYGGLDAFRHPDTKVVKANALVASVPEKIPGISSTEDLVRLDGAAKVAGGVALALGKLPRFAALGLVASLVPTTAAGHRFWEESDPQARKAQQLQFAKNASILGGLLLAVVDTGGKPSLGWRARRTARSLAESAKEQAASAGALAHLT